MADKTDYTEKLNKFFKINEKISINNNLNKYYGSSYYIDYINDIYDNDLEQGTEFFNRKLKDLLTLLSVFNKNSDSEIKELHQIIYHFIPYSLPQRTRKIKIQRNENKRTREHSRYLIHAKKLKNNRNKKVDTSLTNKGKKSLRIQYSYISNFVYNNRENDYLIDSIRDTLDYLTINTILFSDNELRFLNKIKDHINLCVIQYEMVNEKLEDVREATEVLNQAIINNQKIDKKVKKTKKDVEKTKKDVENLDNKIISQVLSIVSVFTGLAFIVFGGLSLFSDLTVFFKGTETNFGLGLVYLSVIGFILLGLIYLFFNFIVYLIKSTDAYLLGKSYSDSEKEKKQKDIKEDKKPKILKKISNSFKRKKRTGVFTVGNVLSLKIFRFLIFTFLLGLFIDSYFGSTALTRWQLQFMHWLHWI
ncbi:MAG: hypothetical protein ACPKM0_03815 [Pleomorphochaeta sp.]